MMGRPRVIKIEEGEVVFKNLSKETTDSLIEKLNMTEEKKESRVVVDSKLPNTAVGTYFDETTNTWNVVTLKFSIKDDTACIEEIKAVSRFKEDAAIHLKRMAIEKGII